MFRKTNGHAKRFDANAMTLSQLQTLKQRLIAALSEFITTISEATTDETRTTIRVASLRKIDAIQLELNAIAIKYALV